MTGAINLIPARRIMAHRQGKRITLWAWVCGVYAVAIVVGIIASAIVQRADHSALNTRLVAATNANDDHRAQIAAMAARVSVARRMIAVHEEVARQPDFSILLAAIGTLVSDVIPATNDSGPTTTLTRLELSPVFTTIAPATGPAAAGVQRTTTSTRAGESVLTAYRVDALGLGRTLSDVNALILRLEASGLFDRVELLGTQREVRGGLDLVSFQMRGTLGQSGGGGRR